MPVNPSSVIPTWVNQWRPDFYTSITDKENYAYTNPGGGSQAGWQAQFQLLASAMTSYRGFNRETEMTDFYFGTYGYEVLHKVYGSSNSLEPTLDEREIYNMNGFVAATLGRPLNYYSDWTVDPLNPGAGNSPRLTADIDVVQNATAAETPRIAARAQSTLYTIRRLQVDLLFKEIPTTGDPSGKQVMGELFFNTLHWKEAYVLNVGTLTLPPYIT